MRRRSTLRRVLPMQSEFCPVVVGRFGFQGCIAMGDRQRLHRWLTRCLGNGNHWSRRCDRATFRSEEHTSELQSLMRTSYAAFCLNKTKPENTQHKAND